MPKPYIAYIRKLLLPAILLLIGGVAGYHIHDRVVEKRKIAFTLKREAGYTFIKPLVAVETAPDYVGNIAIQPINATVTDFIEHRMNITGVDSVSVYYRDLDSGLWFGIGDFERYAPASLMKVALMIAAYKESEFDEDFLNHDIRYDGSFDLNAIQWTKPSVRITAGSKYMIEDLIRRMIVYSDNNAANLLERIVNPVLLKKVYADFGMPDPYSPKVDHAVSAATYSALLRTLYNASYIDRRASEKALAYLAESEFRAGLVDGVPNNIAVAHKFGEATEAGTNKRQLHDCGIIYYPSHPYLLCVMTHGANFETLDNAIDAISRVVYESVDKQYKP